jgi:2-iminoacetate synthase
MDCGLSAKARVNGNMSLDTHSCLSRFSDWLRQTDPHAEHHRALLERAESLLLSDSTTDTDDRRQLTERLERWRYQHLNERTGRLEAQDEALLDALDTMANRLAGRAERAPRATRHAIADPAVDTAWMRQAFGMLDEGVAIDEWADLAQQVTRENFNATDDNRASARTAQRQRHRVFLYAPLYVSSQCINYCTYCGFRYPLEIDRRHLTVEQAGTEADILLSRGLRHLLIVGGDFPSQTTTDYYRQIAQTLVDRGAFPSIEIAAQTTASYAQLVDAGVCGLTLYQETYDESRYSTYHVRGPKASYHWRLEAHDRAAESGMSRLGLGILLGLADPYRDLLAMMRHAAYLARRFPDRRLAFSLPRIHEAPEAFQVPYPVSDEELMRMYCALRIAFPQAELVLSTRESAALRNRLARICITQMSAGSSTTPGGYQAAADAGGEQFPVADHRPVHEVADWLSSEGFRVTYQT